MRIQHWGVSSTTSTAKCFTIKKVKRRLLFLMKMRLLFIGKTGDRLVCSWRFEAYHYKCSTEETFLLVILKRMHGITWKSRKNLSFVTDSKVLLMKTAWNCQKSWRVNELLKNTFNRNIVKSCTMNHTVNGYYISCYLYYHVNSHICYHTQTIYEWISKCGILCHILYIFYISGESRGEN